MPSATLPTTADVSSLADAVAFRLSAACQAHRQLANERAAIDAAMKRLMDDEIRPLVADLGLTKITGRDWQLINSPGGRTDIDARKLLERGVPIETVTYATVRRMWSSWQVRDAQRGDDDNTE